MIDFPIETQVRCGSNGRSYLVTTYEVASTPSEYDWTYPPDSTPPVKRYVVGAVIYEFNAFDRLSGDDERLAESVYDDPLEASVRHWERVKLIADAKPAAREDVEEW